MKRAVHAALLGAALAAFVPASSWARGQLQAAPTLVELVPGATAGRLTLSNTGDTPIAAQVRVYAWNQVDGEDRLGATQAVIISPAIVQIAPGTTQVVRVVREGAPPVGHDGTYRLVVDELPTPGEVPQSGVQIRMRFVVPVYARAPKAAAPALRCRLNAAQLACTNGGGQAAQLGATKLADAGGHSVALTGGLFGYVLPGSERRWPLAAASLTKLTGDLRLETRVNGLPLSVPVSRAP